MKNQNDFLSHFPDIETLLKSASGTEVEAFYNFANALGCFSNKKFLDINGCKTQVSFSQKSSSVLADLLKNGQIKIGDFHKHFSSIKKSDLTTQEFVMFIAPFGSIKYSDNFDMLINLDNEIPGVFINVMLNFDTVKEYRNVLKINDKLVRMTWKEAIIRYLQGVNYYHVDDENMDIALIYSSKSLSQNYFDEAVSLRQIANTNLVPSHILESPLFEDNTNVFRYEWLDKKNAINGVLGWYVNSCGSLNSEGRNLAIATIVSPNVQNIIVRNLKNDIVAKGTIFVNRAIGYGVINDFELNSQYKKDEILPGKYKASIHTKYEEYRTMIFDAFMRGIHDFIFEYNIRFSSMKLTQINIGTGFNRLMNQINDYEEAKENLYVPRELGFTDANDYIQRVLYIV